MRLIKAFHRHDWTPPRRMAARGLSVIMMRRSAKLDGAYCRHSGWSKLQERV